MVTAVTYLDCNAGAPPREEVIAALALVLADPGNPSSIHGPGRRARARLEEARSSVARAVGAEAAGVVFTSGGTEANDLALWGTGRPRVLVSAVEHPSIREACAEAEVIPVDAAGRVDPETVARMLAADLRPALVSVMLANNETGVLQPVAAIADHAHRAGALMHCDAAQALGRMPVVLADLGVDLLTVSAHKAGGPAGIGALILAAPDFPLIPRIHGGGQEKRRRPGTENLAGIVGFGVAARLAAAEVAEGKVIARMRRLRDRLETDACRRVPATVCVARDAERLCNTASLALPGVASQTLVMALDLAGIAVSAGSACSSGKVTASPVLAAMGLDRAVAGSAVRVSLGPASADEDIERFLAAWADIAVRKGLDVKDAA